MIRESVAIDKQIGRGVAKLPFLTDPAGKLNNNAKGRVQNKKNTVLGNMSVEGGGGSEPIPTALSEKVRDFLHKGGGGYT